MFKVRYKLIKGINTTGFGLRDTETGEELEVKVSEFKQLVANGEVRDWSTVEDKKEVHLCFAGNWEDLETKEEQSKAALSVICRLVNSSNELEGYLVQDESGKKKRVTLAKACELAMNNEFKNVKAEIINGAVSLKGVDGFKLQSIPDLEV